MAFFKIRGGVNEFLKMGILKNELYILELLRKTKYFVLLEKILQLGKRMKEDNQKHNTVFLHEHILKAIENCITTAKFLDMKRRDN